MKITRREIFVVIALIAAAVIAIIFDTVNFHFSDDNVLNSLLIAIIPRTCASAVLIAVILLLNGKNILTDGFDRFTRSLLWCAPCLLVAVVNFPFSAIITSSATVIRHDLIWLFIIKCLITGVYEELLFRGILQSLIYYLLKDKRKPILKSILITSALFAVLHLFNLLGNSSVGETFLQTVYSFLLGAMLSAVMFKTKNIWICIFIHALFNFGGNIITDLGAGNFQDLTFWILTAVSGILCFAHILIYVIKTEKQ